MMAQANLKSRHGAGWLFLAALFMVLPSLVQGAESGAIQSVRFEPSVFNPAQGQSTSLFFYLTAHAEITATVYDSDHFVITTIAEKRAGVPGTNQISWNGKDDQGVIVPDEAYYVVLESAGGAGADFRYDPALISGGETVGITPAEVDREKGTVSFTLSQAAKVRLRAGVHEGPLCNTLLDWEPLARGVHVIPWDGKDAFGTATVWDHKRFNMVSEAFALPLASVITKGSAFSKKDYWGGVAEKSGSRVLAYRLSSSDALKANDKAKTVSMRALLSKERTMHKSGLSNQFLSGEPKLSIATAKQVGDTPHRMNITISLDNFTKEVLNETRYEYVLYVDNVRQEEKETGYSPYTWAYNTKSLPVGDHVLTVNVCTIDGRIGIASTIIDVKK
jgi:hypothetical protein